MDIEISENLLNKDRRYFGELIGRIRQAYDTAEKARSKGFDPSQYVESIPAGDLASRVEGLVGPDGIAKVIKELGRDNISAILDRMIGDKVHKDFLPETHVEKATEIVEQALRTGLAILTEGVVAAPIEGISKVEINSNPDDSKYISVYFAGPIRSAGGTAQGMAILIAAYLQKKLGLKGYIPTADEVERYVEEIRLYNEFVTNLQYMPSDNEIRTIVKNTGVCIDGDSTEKREVGVHRDLERVHTNAIRGGMCLVIGEGMAQKARKLVKKSSDFNIDWSWLESMKGAPAKLESKDESGIVKDMVIPAGIDALGGDLDDLEDIEDKEIYDEFDIENIFEKEDKIEPIYKLMKETVGGRPIFSAPSRKGGFRLRYGRSRASGLAAKSIHPAAMILLDEFVATGTQVKVERPGKGTIITACDTIESPIARLKSGDVVRVETVEQSRYAYENLSEILFLGDILTSYGDFLQTNHPLAPAGYCEEWWLCDLLDAIEKEGENKKGKLKFVDDLICGKIDILRQSPTPDDAVEISKIYSVPLHPRYTYHWEDTGFDFIKKLFNAVISALSEGEVEFVELGGNFEFHEKFYKNSGDAAISIPLGDDEKKTMEFLGVPHYVTKIKKEGKFINYLVISEYLPFLYQMGLGEAVNPAGKKIDSEFVENFKDKFEKVLKSIDLRSDTSKDNETGDSFKFIEKFTNIKLRKKSGTYIGTRMGRPEKARERKMQPPVHALFPIGESGGKERSINLAVSKGTIKVEVANLKCPHCGAFTPANYCNVCGTKTEFVPVCSKCGIEVKNLKAGTDKCPSCSAYIRVSKDQDVNLSKIWEDAHKNLDVRSLGVVKGVRGMISSSKVPERIEKGILRAQHRVFVFKDGTIRFDATDAPLTHFKPCEIGISVEYLKKLGYEKDYLGNSITGENQIIEMKVQDIILSYNAAVYLMKSAKFIDDLLDKFYGVGRFYNIESKEDLLGHLVVGLAPHTSAGIIGRIAGFNAANVGFAHPFWHAAKRRNCFDGGTKIPVLENDEWKLVAINELVEKNLTDITNIRNITKDDFGTVYSTVNWLKTLTFNQETREFEIAEISHVSRHAPQKTITLKTKSGREITTTLDHPFPTKNGKKIAAEVDEVFVPHITDIFKGKNIKIIIEKLIKNVGKKSGTEKIDKYGDVFVDKIINKKFNSNSEMVYSLTVPPHHTIIANGIVSHQCDGDEDAIMLLMDTLLNFSRSYLPEKRGGKMDAPLVVTTILDPNEVDDESHKMEIVSKYPGNFYEKTIQCSSPGDVDIDIVEKHLAGDPYHNLKFTHDNGNITGPVITTRYVKLKTMQEKVRAQLRVAEKVRAIDACDVAEILLNSHFLRDTYGNLRAFSRQKFRCSSCNASYRRVPLSGVCKKCGGKLLLTVTEGSVKKYLEMSKGLAEKYNLSDYLKQRLKLLDNDIKSLFVNDLSKQVGLGEFM